MTATDNRERPSNGHAGPDTVAFSRRGTIDLSVPHSTLTDAESPLGADEGAALAGPDIGSGRDVRLDLGWPFVGVIMALTAAIAALLLLA